MPFDCRLGTHKIWIGAPLPGFIKWETLPSLPVSEDSLTVTLQCVDAEDRDFRGSSITRSFALDRSLAVRIELPTDQLIPGAYELMLSIPGKEQWNVPQPLWVLSRDQYLHLTRDEAEEEFLAAPPLERIEELVALVEEMIRERLRIPIFDQGRLASPTIEKQRVRDSISIFGPSREGLFERPISSAPIRWTTEGMVDEANYIAIGGVKSFNIHVEVTRNAFGLRFQAVLNEPLSAAMSQALNEVNDFRLLNIKGDLKDFVAQLQVVPFTSEIELVVRQAIEGHPVLKIDPSQVQRPVGVLTAKKMFP